VIGRHESRLRCGFELGLKDGFIHVAPGFGKKQRRTCFRGSGNLIKEVSRVRQFVDYGEREREIDRPRQIADAQTIRRSETSIHSPKKASFGGTALQFRQHPGLNVDGDDPARRSDQAGKLQCEEAHAGPRLQYRHAFTDIR